MRKSTRSSVSTTPPTKTLAVVGAGPKALALAAKARVLAQLDILHVRTVIIEQHRVAANWTGGHGYTDGRQPLGTSPEKDVGFPYRSMFGPEVDRAMMHYSWPMYQVSTGRYGTWVDRGRNHPTHREWAHYLEYVFAEASPEFMLEARLDQVRFERHGFELVVGNDHGDRGTLRADGVVFTGPGKPMKTAGATYAWTKRILHGQNVYTELDTFRRPDVRRVAVIGGGETAASAVLGLLRPGLDLEIDVIYRGGAVYTRGESYAENRRFTNPAGWPSLSQEEREEFIRRTDRGVFSVAANDVIDDAENVTIINGEVVDLKDTGDQVEVQLRRYRREVEYTYDVVVVAIGYDPTTPFHLMPLRARLPWKIDKLRKRMDEHLRIPHPLRRITDHTEYVNLHLPMLAGLAQGPGFPNLSCLGVLSDRILSAYLDEGVHASDDSPVPFPSPSLEPAA
jgi:mycobactin lysine-N-oxygenase